MFRKGHKRSPESIERQRATVRQKYEDGFVSPNRGRKMSPETIAKRNTTRRQNAVGNTTLQRCGKLTYRKVMTEDGYRSEHRHLMEQALGRKLERWEHVHHINENTLDNRLENLEVKSSADHTRHHLKGKPGPTRGMKLLTRWSKDYGDSCSDCGTTEREHFCRGMCKNCHMRWYRRKREAEGRPLRP